MPSLRIILRSVVHDLCDLDFYFEREKSDFVSIDVLLIAVALLSAIFGLLCFFIFAMTAHQ